MKKILILFNLLVFMFISCSEPAPTTMFTLLSSGDTGISFSNDLIDDATDDDHNVLSFYHYFNGGGVAVGDLNNDGLPEVLFTGNEVPNKLYLNKGNMKFEDISDKAGINNGKHWATGVTISDVNGDGWNDIYICQSSTFTVKAEDRKNLLFINNKDLTFSEEAAQYGLDDSNLSHMAVFFDYDNDGDNDCFVANTSQFVRMDIDLVAEYLKNKQVLIEASSNLYRNDNGKFTQVTESAGLLRQGFALGMVVSDINDDGFPDIYQANDYSVPDFMYINQGDGTFRDEIKERSNHISWFAMGCDIADFDNDGAYDIAVVDMSSNDHIRGKTLMAPMNTDLFNSFITERKLQHQYMFNTLQKNNGEGQFSDVASLSGIQNTEWSWAAFFADFDNDGFKDYFVANGYKRYSQDNDSRRRIAKVRQEYNNSVPVDLRKELYDQIPQVKLPNFINRNKGDLTFEEVSSSWGMDQPSYSNGAAYADLDGDGDLDLLVNNIDENAFVYRNNARQLNGNNFIQVVLKSNKSIETTKVIVTTADMEQVLEYGPVRGFQSSMDDKLHFGLGTTENVDKIAVWWSDDTFEIFNDVKANQVITVEHSNAKPGKMNKSQKEKWVAINNESGINFQHVENEYDDFKKEILLPYKQSTLGPLMSSGDVNGDGLDDIFIGGAKDQAGSLYLQESNGKYQISSSSPWKAHASSEDMGSHLFDADGDGDLDLYVVSGGNEFETEDPALKDRMYFNNGNGNFSYSAQAIPDMRESGSRVKSADIDGDGDLDLFVGGRLIPQLYPNAPRSYILENNNGTFIDVTEKWSNELLRPGLVNDFVWTDLNGDKLPDLVIVGEWMPIRFFTNSGSSFTESTSTKMDKELKGWWMRIHEKDIDGDGDMDFIVGNLGENSKFHTSDAKPFEVLANDFDQNGTMDIVLTKKYNGKTVPVRGKECSSQQMPFITNKFPTYKEFAEASIEDILGEEMVSKAVKLSVNTFATTILINNGDGTFSHEHLPNEAQIAPTYGIATIDINGDGNMDVILSGNQFQTEVETPRLDGGKGCVLLGDGKGKFTISPVSQTGFLADLDGRDMILLNKKDGQFDIIVSNNNGRVQIFSSNKKAS